MSHTKQTGNSSPLDLWMLRIRTALPAVSSGGAQGSRVFPAFSRMR